MPKSNQKLDQLIAAATTVKKTQSSRRKALIRLLQSHLQKEKPDPRLAAVVYYLSLGAVPHSLWE